MEVASWVTPSSLFVLLNLIIGTILVTSKLQKRSHLDPDPDRDSPRRLARATSSMIDRVRSLNLSLYNFDPPAPSEPQHHNPTTELTRSPSLLERLKSVCKPEPEPAIRPEDATSEVGRPTRELARSPSLLERLKSVYRPDPEPDHVYPVQDHGVRRSKSDHAKSEVVRAKGKKMTKSASEKGVENPKGSAEEEDDTAVERRRPATTTTAGTLPAAEGTGVDAQADDFINKFRQQLRLQRLESLKRFTDMIHGR